jgi:hypothetical protein
MLAHGHTYYVNPAIPTSGIGRGIPQPGNSDFHRFHTRSQRIFVHLTPATPSHHEVKLRNVYQGWGRRFSKTSSQVVVHDSCLVVFILISHKGKVVLHVHTDGFFSVAGIYRDKSATRSIIGLEQELGNVQESRSNALSLVPHLGLPSERF